MSDEYGANHQKIELGSHPQVQENRPWLMTIFWQTFALLWLVPIAALLYLNISGYVIGASAWCPAGQCWINAFNFVSAVPQNKMRGFDHESHNLLGGLQFVAKALEVWFGIIAAALIYLVTMRFAGTKEGLPIGYLTRPLEFADVVGLFDKLFWFTGPTPFGIKSQGEKRVGRRVWALITLSVFLCILINLMGPATAVLVIPSLQWVTTPQVGNRMFVNLNANSPPKIGLESWTWWDSANCNEHDFRTHNYSCNLEPLGVALDTWIDSALAGSGNTGSGYTTQSGLVFSINQTEKVSTKNSLEQFKATSKAHLSDLVYWAPSRQIISNLSVDQNVIAQLSRGFSVNAVERQTDNWVYFPDPIDTYVEYNKSLELSIRRNGPIAGAVMNKITRYNDYGRWTVDVDAHRQIRCYTWYDLFFYPLAEGSSYGNYTKCIRLGKGWSDLNKKASFSAPGAYDAVSEKQGPGVDVDIYSSDRAVFLPNGTLPSWLPAACLSDESRNGSLLNQTHCDWKRLFATDPTSPVANRTENVTTIEMNYQDGKSSVMLVVDFVSYLAFTTYQLDPFLFSNPASYVQTADLPSYGTSFHVDPTWVLTGWSVGEGGSLFANRTSTNLLLDVMGRLLADPYDNVQIGLAEGDYKIDYLSFLPVMQTLSLIDHSTVGTSQTHITDHAHPLLQRNAQMYVWAYSLGSRTSYLGAAVAIAGALVVLWQFVLGFFDRRRYRSPTQLLVACLEHCPRGEFAGKDHDEKEMARVRFHIRDDVSRVGKYSFYEANSSD